MKGLLLLFISIVIVMISWSYLDSSSRKGVKKFISRHMWAVAVAVLAVAIAVFFSINTTLRLV